MRRRRAVTGELDAKAQRQQRLRDVVEQQRAMGLDKEVHDRNFEFEFVTKKGIRFCSSFAIARQLDFMMMRLTSKGRFSEWPHLLQAGTTFMFGGGGGRGGGGDFGPPGRGTGRGFSPGGRGGARGRGRFNDFGGGVHLCSRSGM